MTGPFKDQVVLVTGAGRGLGRAIAQTFAGRGAVVAANDITPVNLDETIAHISASGGRARDYIYDIAKKMPVLSLVDQVLADWGRIDVLVNAAAVSPSAALMEIGEWDWQRTLDVNLSGPFYAIQAVGRQMREQGGGAILNLVLSEGWVQASREGAAYLASKHGLVGLTRQAAAELAPYQVRVNALAPPPAGDLTQAVELALFLCSPAAAAISGQVFYCSN